MSKFFNRLKKEEEIPVIEEQVPVWEDRIFWVETLQKIALPVLMNLNFLLPTSINVKPTRFNKPSYKNTG